MQAVLLILALSIDIFIACAACGAEHITIGTGQHSASVESAAECCFFP